MTLEQKITNQETLLNVLELVKQNQIQSSNQENKLENNTEKTQTFMWCTSTLTVLLAAV